MLTMTLQLRCPTGGDTFSSTVSCKRAGGASHPDDNHPELGKAENTQGTDPALCARRCLEEPLGAKGFSQIPKGLQRTGTCTTVTTTLQESSEGCGQMTSQARTKNILISSDSFYYVPRLKKKTKKNTTLNLQFPPPPAGRKMKTLNIRNP